MAIAQTTAAKAPPVLPPTEQSAVAPTELPAEPAAAKPFRPLANGRLKLIRGSETNFGNLWGAVLSAETTLDDATDPAFWSNHAHVVRASDEIRIEWDDGRGLVRAFVRQVSGAGTNMSRVAIAIESTCDFDPIRQLPAAAGGYGIEFRGPHLKFVIVRLSDTKIVGENYDSPQAASTALQAIIRHNPKGR